MTIVRRRNLRQHDGIATFIDQILILWRDIEFFDTEEEAHEELISLIELRRDGLRHLEIRDFKNLLGTESIQYLDPDIAWTSIQGELGRIVCNSELMHTLTRWTPPRLIVLLSTKTCTNEALRSELMARRWTT